MHLAWFICSNPLCAVKEYKWILVHGCDLWATNKNKSEFTMWDPSNCCLWFAFSRDALCFECRIRGKSTVDSKDQYQTSLETFKAGNFVWHNNFQWVLHNIMNLTSCYQGIPRSASRRMRVIYGLWCKHIPWWQVTLHQRPHASVSTVESEILPRERWAPQTVNPCDCINSAPTEPCNLLAPNHP